MTNLIYKSFIIVASLLLFSPSLASDKRTLTVRSIDGISWYGHIFKMEMGPLDLKDGIRYRILLVKEEASTNIFIEKLNENEEGLIQLTETFFVDIYDVLSSEISKPRLGLIDKIKWRSPSVVLLESNNISFYLHLDKGHWYIKILGEK